MDARAMSLQPVLESLVADCTAVSGSHRPAVVDGVLEQLLLYACSKGLQPSSQWILRQDVDANAVVRSTGSAPLHLVLQNSERSGDAATKELVEALLRHGSANPNACNSDDWTPLHLAAVTQGDSHVVQLLLDKGASCAARDVYGRGPFHLACWAGRCSIVEKLLEHVTDINETDSSGWLPLHYSCRFGREECVRLLLQRSVEGINAPTHSGWTPLHFACGHGHKSIVSMLLSKDVDVTAAGNLHRTALHWAAAGGYVDVVVMLLDAPASVDVDSTDEGGWTALMFAARNGHSELVRVLLARGADAQCKTGRGSSIYRLAAREVRRNVLAALPR